MKRFFKILGLIKPYWPFALLNVIFNIVSSILNLFSLAMLMPFLSILFNSSKRVYTSVPFEFNAEALQHNLGYMITKIIEHFNNVEAGLIAVCIFVVVMTILKNLSTFLANYYMTPVRANVVRDMRNKLYDKILVLPLSFYSDARKGDIMSKMTQDVQEIEFSIMSSLEMLFRDPITVVVFLVFLFLMSFQLTLFVLVLLPISGLIIGKIGRSLRASSKKGQQRMGMMLSIIEETLGGLRIIKGFNGEQKMMDKFHTTNEFYNKMQKHLMRRRYLASPLSEAMGVMVLIIVMWYGGKLVLSGTSGFTPEALIAYIAVFSQILNPAKAFSTAYFNIQKGMASADRIDTILDAEVTIKDPETSVKTPEVFEGKIEFKNVNFSYASEPVLKDINLVVEKGRTIALVGRSGSGKSTLVDLLPRFIDPIDGVVLIDGIPVKDYKLIDLRNLMGIVSQESILFNDTFFNNIAFGMPKATIEDVIAASKVANAFEFINETPNGFYTNIGDRGGKLSGGQRQRISIARAVLKNPPILILDEATSALDTESERLVQDAIINLMMNRTSIVIAHRLSTIKHADEIVVIDEGRIVERGKHDELLAHKGIYKKLHKMQMF